MTSETSAALISAFLIRLISSSAITHKVSQIFWNRLPSPLWLPHDLKTLPTSLAAFISIAFSRNGVSHSLAAKLCRPRFKSFFLDSAPCNIRQAFNAFDAVFFAPSDLFLFNSAPAARRRFLNLFVAQWNPIYFADLQAFNRLIVQRNSLLKSIREGIASPADLNLWNEGLAQAAAKITSKRLAALDNLSLCRKPKRAR